MTRSLRDQDCVATELEMVDPMEEKFKAKPSLECAIVCLFCVKQPMLPLHPVIATVAHVCAWAAWEMTVPVVVSVKMNSRFCPPQPPKRP